MGELDQMLMLRWVPQVAKTGPWVIASRNFKWKGGCAPQWLNDAWVTAEAEEEYRHSRACAVRG